MRMSKQSRLHLPRVPARPGEAPDFSYVQLSPAGAVPRPEINARARDMLSLSVDLVRVLDDAGEAIGPWNPHLDPDELQVGLRHMMLTRAVRRSHAAHAARRQDLLLHSLFG